VHDREHRQFISNDTISDDVGDITQNLTRPSDPTWASKKRINGKRVDGSHNSQDDAFGSVRIISPNICTDFVEAA